MQNLTSLSQSGSGNITLKNGKTITMKGARTNGTFVSATIGSGNVLSSSVTAIERVHADDGGVALTTGSLRGSLSRVLIDTAVVGGSFTMRGSMGQVKVDASVVTSGPVAGVEGYVELTSTGVCGGNFTGVRGCVDVVASGVIASGKVLSAFLASSTDMRGTHTGNAVVLDVQVPNAGGVWDYFMNIPAATGITSAGTTKTTPGGVGTWIKVIIDGTAAYIPTYASTTT